MPCWEVVMRIGICSYFDAPIRQWAEPCSRAMVRYAQANGYAYIRPAEPVDPKRPAPWQKPEILLRNLGQMDYLAWIDADVVITNAAFRIESITASGADLYVNRDVNGFNNGVAIWRNSPATFDLLIRWRDCGPHRNPLSDQFTLERCIRESGDGLRVEWVEQRVMNAYDYQHQQGDWLVHFAGLKNRMELTGKYCRRYCPEALA